MEAEDLREVYESFSESTHDIDQEQKEVMDDVLESPKDLGVGTTNCSIIWSIQTGRFSR